MAIRHFLLIAALTSGGFAVIGPVSGETPISTAAEAEDAFAGHANADEIDYEAGIVAVEVASDTGYSIPGHDTGDEVFLAELSENSTNSHLDIAGVERTAAGRPIDAQPGSLDAALTGMQHDAGGTVRNTVSPEPTPSLVVANAVAENPELREQPAPSADVVTEEKSSD